MQLKIKDLLYATSASQAGMPLRMVPPNVKYVGQALYNLAEERHFALTVLRETIPKICRSHSYALNALKVGIIRILLVIRVCLYPKASNPTKIFPILFHVPLELCQMAEHRIVLQ